MTEQTNLNSIWQSFQAFIQPFQSAVLSTLSPQNEPQASYAPVLQQQNAFYIYISELADHTRNLQQNPKAELFFIEDESRCENIFARQRASIKITAQPIARDSEQWRDVMTQFGQLQPEMIPMLRELTDFHLFKLTPYHARYVKGFAQAFNLDGEQLKQVAHLNDKGHRKT